jgi:hypothetical protein
MKAGIRLTPVHQSAWLREVLFYAILPIARVIDQARAEEHLPIPDRLIQDSDVLGRRQRSGDQRLHKFTHHPRSRLVYQKLETVMAKYNRWQFHR